MCVFSVLRVSVFTNGKKIYLSQKGDRLPINNFLKLLIASQLAYSSVFNFGFGGVNIA